MTWGISTSAFIQLHVLLSLVGIVAGLMTVVEMVRRNLMSSWTHAFLATTVLTSVTGFPLPPFGMDPPRILGIISLVLLAVAAVALYWQHLDGGWRTVYVVSALAALYLNCFVAIVQAFQKLAVLRPLAPTQSEPPFIAAQVVLLVAFVAIGRAIIRNLAARSTVHQPSR
jgi:hypothetical protein